MKSLISLLIVVLVASFTLTITACEKKGPAEKAGEKIDHAVQKTSDSMHDAAKKVEDSVK